MALTRSNQPKPPAIVIVRQNGLSSAICRASVAVTPVCVTADLVNPGGECPTTGTSPFLRQPLAICCLGVHFIYADFILFAAMYQLPMLILIVLYYIFRYIGQSTLFLPYIWTFQ